MRRLVPPCLGIVLLGNAGCPAPALENWSASDPIDPPSSATASGSTTQVEEPSADAGPQVPTTTAAPGSTSFGSGSTGETSTTTDDDLLPPPEIVGHGLAPTTLQYPEPIIATIITKHADSLRVQVDEDDASIILPAQADTFKHELVFLSAQTNGPHVARFVALRGELMSDVLEIPFTVALPDAGTELYWDESPSIGPGHIVALAVTPAHALIELGTYFLAGQPRCYLRRRTLFGPANAFIDLMPGTTCTAKDLAAGPDGALYVLVDRLENSAFRWWLGKYTTWGQSPIVVRTGAADEQAHSLALDPARVAVCGTRDKVTDLDATVWIFHPNNDQPAKTLSFESDPNSEDAKIFNDIPNGCAFTDNELVLAGNILGDHDDDDDVLRERHFVLEVDMVTEKPPFHIAPPGPGTQSRASAIAVGTSDRYITAGQFCDDVCDARGELRMFFPGGTPIWHKLLDPAVASPRDIGWSPADYIVYAGSRVEGQNTESFFVEAWIPLHGVPFWSFAHVAGTGASARALAFGPYGQIYAGGSTGDGFPALAIIAP